MALRAAAKLAALGGAGSAAGVGAYAQYDEGTRAFASALVLPPPLPRSPTTTPRAPVPTRPPPPTADRSPSPEPDLEPNAGTARSMTFWYHCLPVYAQYRAVQFRNRDALRLGVPAWTGVPLDDHDADAAYNALHDAHAGNVRDLVLRMRGFYFKNAQLLSTRDDFVPPQYLEWCKTTQDAAPAEMAPGEARRIVDARLAELGHPDAIEWWDETPAGVASIGTVHRARLTPAYGSKDVVIKVQAPGIERKFRADIRTCIDFCRLAMPQHAPPLEEIERQFLTEFDYRAEARNLEEVRAAVLPEWGHKVDIPAPHPELCAKDVLVMDRLPGKKLVDGLRDRLADVARARGTTAEALEAEQRAKIDRGELIPRDVAEEARATRRANALIAATDVLVRQPLAFLLRRRFEPSPRLVNMGEVLQTMLDVHADEIFRHGVFNGDPHPGNILLMPDGRLGLIDYGQVKRVPEHVRVAYAKLTLAILAEDKDEIARLCQSDPPEGFGGKSRYADKDVAYRLAMFWNDRDTPDVTMGLNLQEFIDEMEARDPVVRAPADMVMIARVSILLRGVANAFNVRLKVANAWRAHAETLLRRTQPDYYLLDAGGAGGRESDSERCGARARGGP